MDPIYDTKQDGETVARVAEKLDEKIPPEERNVDSYRAYFDKFLDDDKDVRDYIQQTLDAGMTTRDIDVEDIEDGPERLQLKTYPRIPFYSQIHEDRPFYTKTGRMEFHKEEDRFLELGRADLDHIESPEGTPYGVNQKWDEAKDEENPRTACRRSTKRCTSVSTNSTPTRTPGRRATTSSTCGRWPTRTPPTW